jgi:hypothetical protein
MLYTRLATPDLKFLYGISPVRLLGGQHDVNCIQDLMSYYQ